MSTSRTHDIGVVVMVAGSGRVSQTDVVRAEGILGLGAAADVGAAAASWRGARLKSMKQAVVARHHHVWVALARWGSRGQLALDGLRVVGALRHHGIVHERLAIGVGHAALRVVVRRRRAHGTGAGAAGMMEASEARTVAAASTRVAIGRVGRGRGGLTRGVALPAAAAGLAAAVARSALDAVLDGPVLERPLGRALGLAGDFVDEGGGGSGHLSLLAFTLDEALCVNHKSETNTLLKRGDGVICWTYSVHAKIMADAVLPSLAAALGLVRVVPEPLVDLLEAHAAVWTAHEGSKDELGVRRSVLRCVGGLPDELCLERFIGIEAVVVDMSLL